MLRNRLDYSYNVAKGFDKTCCFHNSSLRSGMPQHVLNRRTYSLASNLQKHTNLFIYCNQKRCFSLKHSPNTLNMKCTDNNEDAKQLEDAFNRDDQVCGWALRAICSYLTIGIHNTDTTSSETGLSNGVNDLIDFEMSSVLKKRRKAMNKHKRKKRAKAQRYKTDRRKR